jgi:asparagine synthase (glutamine-hydrolysing)
MCGIAGILRTDGNPIPNREIKEMTLSLAHRGPDGEGIFIEGNIAIGHRRLSIIDPECGKQPMSNEDSSVWITYNGELYNYLSLKSELEKKHVFRTHSDTEVIVHAYEEWGYECVTKFRGMFAFAIVDLNKKSLFLARDHLGIKPLYYRIGDTFFSFASEINALVRNNHQNLTGNLAAVEFFLRYQYIPSPLTIYNEIKKIPPGCYLTCSFDGKKRDLKRFFDLSGWENASDNQLSGASDADKVITDSVSSHLVADVPFGVFLSGGIDSTLVAMTMKKCLKTPIKAFAIGFDQEDYNELEYAKKAAREIGLDLYTEIVTEDILESLPELIQHYGEPFGDSSALPTWAVSRLARKHVPMVLSGDGGDEMFAGYDSYRYWMMENTLAGIFHHSRQNFPRNIKSGIIMLIDHFKNFSHNSVSAWEKYIIYLKYADRKKIWLPKYHYLLTKSCDLFIDSETEAQKMDRLSFAQYIDKKTYLPCDILTKVDIASMYHGLEVRVPLIDRCVNKYAMRLPLHEKTGSDPDGNDSGKNVLKKILLKKFDPDFVYRKKKGFGIPRSVWFLPGHKAREMLEQRLISKNERISQFFVINEINHLLKIHTKEKDNSGILWLILVLCIWFEQNPHITFHQEKMGIKN